MQTFYNRLTNETKTLVDIVVGGFFMGKSIEVAMKLFKEMVTNAYQWPFECNTPKKTLGVHELDVLTTLSSQVTTLSKQVSFLIA